MVRTKADSSSGKASVKASRKITSFPAQSCAGARSSDYGKGKQNTGGNPYLPRETPSWQKEISCFFKSATVESMNKNQTSSNQKSTQEMSMRNILPPSRLKEPL